jgi:hypothetical protein
VSLFLNDPKEDRAKLVYTKSPRKPGTCGWINSDALYISWLQSDFQLLWISGGSGQGKTMLSIFVAEEVEHVMKTKDVVLLQYFCDRTNPKRNTVVAIMRGMILQLLQLQPDLITCLLAGLQTQGLYYFVSFEPLWRIFENMLFNNRLGRVYCIIDGLDECDENCLEILLWKIRALFRDRAGKRNAKMLNMIITSRDDPSYITDVLSSFPHICMDKVSHANKFNLPDVNLVTSKSSIFSSLSPFKGQCSKFS